MPTILELAEVSIPKTVQAKSLLPLIQGKKTQERDIVVSSTGFGGPENRVLPDWITITSKEWVLISAKSDVSQKDELGRKIQSELYNIIKDPSETKNLYNDKTEIAKELYNKMLQFLKSVGTDKKILGTAHKK